MGTVHLSSVKAQRKLCGCRTWCYVALHIWICVLRTRKRKHRSHQGVFVLTPYVLIYVCIYSIAHSHSRAKNGTDVSLLSLSYLLGPQPKALVLLSKEGSTWSRGPATQAPPLKLETWMAPQCPKHRHLVVFLHLILPVLSFPASWLIPADPL